MEFGRFFELLMPEVGFLECSYWLGVPREERLSVQVVKGRGDDGEFGL